MDSEFRCNPTSGTVGPSELLQATVSYTPAVVDAVSVEYMSLECPGALNKTQLKLTGDCIGRGHTDECRLHKIAVVYLINWSHTARV